MSSLPFTSGWAYHLLIQNEVEKRKLQRLQAVRQRTSEQNRKMWAMLMEVSARLKHCGKYWSPDQWKAIFLKAFGREVDFLPTLDGDDWFPYTASSSKLTVKQMAEFLTFIAVEANARGVVFADDPVDDPSRTSG